MYVKFKGDKRKLARLAILASVPGLDLEIKSINTPNWVGHWNFEGSSYLINFFCVSDVIIHPINSSLRRPWAVKYPTALSIVEAAGLEVISQMSLEDYYARITMGSQA